MFVFGANRLMLTHYLACSFLGKTISQHYLVAYSSLYKVEAYGAIKKEKESKGIQTGKEVKLSFL